MSAIIDGPYRYRLDRDIGGGPTGRRCVFVMLNPSTADAEQDDPTIRRCKAFAEREGCNRLTVVNLYAYRATDPSDLFTPDDPVGVENERHVTEALVSADLVICAWGAWPRAAKVWRYPRMRAPDPLEIARVHDIALHALKITKAGDPGHPLYVRADAPLLDWPGPPPRKEPAT